jgi:hypothetical protein
MMELKMKTMVCETLFDGRVYLGSIVELKPSRFAAYDSGKCFAGEFANPLAASDALIKGATSVMLLTEAANRKQPDNGLSISSRGQIKPVGTVAYPDTIEGYIPAYQRPREDLFDSIGAGFYKCFSGGILRGYRPYVNCPTLEQYLAFEFLVFNYGGVYHRVDIAYDTDTSLTDRFKQHATVRRRRAGPMMDIGDTTYWDKLEPGETVARLLLCYPSHGRLDPQHRDPVLHIELRITGADNVRRQGIFLGSLLTINAAALFNKNIAWCIVSPQYVRNCMRKAIHKDIAEYRGRETSEATDRYRANLAGREQYRRNRLSRAQIVKDMHLYYVTEIPCPIALPTHLSFRVGETITCNKPTFSSKSRENTYKTVSPLPTTDVNELVDMM